eukprot:gnl/MRDRNA2_/MRDRNA2_73329_c0_seq1.p1 gnl/MRDRNA2_/MRDRNA2_73329_c0~~gnl/MRDRNA2_/MRDRNA2_73329_c0_seq1.p1  ORF type:complete len:253 (+),score=44.01 gnl/MRDRNA2_/MRDRNA2_73329_c0_seq1:72-830(+)
MSMTQELSKEELQIINDGLARRSSKTVDAQSAGQGLAYQMLTSKSVKKGYLIRDMSVMNLLPDVSLIVLKLEESDEIPKETLDHLWLKGVTTIFWTETDRSGKGDFGVLQCPSDGDWTSFLAALCAKPKAVVANLAAKDVYKLVQQLEEKKGPVLYLGKESKDCPAMACSSVGVSCGIAGTEAAKACSSIISLQGWPSTLKNFLEIRAATKQARDEPIKFVGCFKYNCVMMAARLSGTANRRRQRSPCLNHL